MHKIVISFLLLSTISVGNSAVKSDFISNQSERAILSKLKAKIKPTKKSQLAKQVNLVHNASLEDLYKHASTKKNYIEKLKFETLKYKQDAVPVLIKVMKGSDFPEENRWVATFMLGRLMGVKSANFISKFTTHPNWMMRLASLKVLLHLDQKKYTNLYSTALKDKSLIVRHQALEIIRRMELKVLAPQVWKMIYNKANYVGAKGLRKRSPIIGDVIKTVGELGFESVKPVLHKMIENSSYKDLHAHIDYSLSRMYGKRSPAGSFSSKKIFWKSLAKK